MKESNLFNFSIENKLWYIISAIALSLVVRLVLSVLIAWQSYYPASFSKRFFIAVRGTSPVVEFGDYWHPFILGCLELLSYPILMKTDNWSFIGVWLGIKTIAQGIKDPWGSSKRASFNRYLIGNALVLISSFVISDHFVSIQKSDPESWYLKFWRNPIR